MQQPTPPGAQLDQLNGQQAMPQQMMLCPVRLVYETQIYVQPGEQIQPNQAFFLNHQNPPPWIQNRAVPNQVIYVQQLPANPIVPSIQHVDQNQMFMQHFANFQHTIPNQILTQSSQEQVRPNHYQFTNVVHPGTIQNMQNMVANIPTAPNERSTGQIVPSFVPTSSNITPYYSNIPQNAMSVVPNQIDRQIVQNSQPQSIVQNILNTQKTVDIQVRPNLQRTIETQQNQSPPNTVRPQNQPQIMAVNPIPNAPRVQQNINDGSVTNPNQVIQENPSNKILSYPSSLPTYNLPNIQTEGPINRFNLINNASKMSHNIINPLASNLILRNYRQTHIPPYRPIQPRPQTQMSSISGKVSVSVQSNPSVTIQPNRTYVQMQNPVLNMKVQDQNINTIKNNQINNIAENNCNVNRKRKSEFPDETHKKIVATAVMPTNSNVAVKQEKSNFTDNTNDIGVNTSPIHKTGDVTALTVSKSNAIDSKLDKITVTPASGSCKEITTLTESNKGNPVLYNSTDKLVRNTVFTQARGRMPIDKKCAQNIVNAITEQGNLVNDVIKGVVNIDNNIAMKDLLQTKLENISDLKPTENEQTENLTNMKLINKDQCDKQFISNSTEVEEKYKNSNAEVDDIKGREMCSTNGNMDTNNKDNYILTHVLDGYVIQESNMAFPIRKPLREKTVYQNIKDQDNKDERSEISNEIYMKDNSKILNINHLYLNESKNLQEMEKKTHKEKEMIEDNPFSTLKPGSIKSWTMDELATHLSKYSWSETVAVMRDHEIDGESLLLVSKQQLLQIGVNENHAEIMCGFIKS